MSGKITRISGPIVYAQGLEDSGLYDVVNVGNKKLIGEIVRQEKGNSTIQVYEDPTGMYVGEEVVCTNKPLSLFLGPGILGNIYDGIQRPLQAMYNESGSFLLPGQRVEPLDLRKIWHFEACAGIQNDCDIYPGNIRCDILSDIA